MTLALEGKAAYVSLTLGLPEAIDGPASAVSAETLEEGCLWASSKRTGRKRPSAHRSGSEQGYSLAVLPHRLEASP